VVGPTHPFKGGIAQHTTELARRLSGAGHDVALVSWVHQYPGLLYPGQLTVDDHDRDSEPFEPTNRLLNWYDPMSWVRAGRRLRSADLVVVAHSNPFQIPAYRALLSSSRGSDRPSSRVLVAHNVVPHDAAAWQRRAIGLLGSEVDGVLVHSATEAASAGELLRSVPVREVPLPPFGPALRASSAPRGLRAPGPVRVLVFGFIRPYKGIPVLLKAAAAAPGVTITIRGECWDDVLDAELRDLARRPELLGRVDYRQGYVGADDLEHLLATHDVAALPYLDATGSQNTSLAFGHGLPVLVSDLPALADEVEDGRTGRVLPPGDVDSWAAALGQLTLSRIDSWRAALPVPDPQAEWDAYLSALQSFDVS
jgi:glycosyltransferase involved in cell wall biosynthesis